MFLARRSRAAFDVRHPREREPWFQGLPAKWREDITRDRLADRAREEELAGREVRRGGFEAAQMALLFAATDLVCPERSLRTVLIAALAGAILGWIASRLDLKRFTTCALGLLSMLVLQWTLRGGLTALHLLVFFPFASACAYLGYLREDR